MLTVCLSSIDFSAFSAYLSVLCVRQQLKRRARRDTPRELALSNRFFRELLS